jgi:UDP-GlcNAc:undecaprenyl-phosphate GlcNAc-1-phosphate transferase
MGVPILLFLLPILDTVLVTFTRLLRGQSPVRGGRDHTSHRLIAFGLSERQTVFALYGIALVCGIAAASLEAIQYWYSLVLAPILVISLAVLFAYLGGVRVLQPESEYPKSTRFTRIMVDLAFRKRLLEVVLDFLLISLAYYLAFLVGNGLRLNDILINRYLSSLPVILIAAYILFFALGIYRIVWRYIGLSDLLRLSGASVGCGFFTAGIFLILDAVRLEIWDKSSSPSALVLGLFSVFLFLGLAASRSSFRIIEVMIHKKNGEEVPVLIYGAGEEGIMLVDWMHTHSQYNYKPVGFIDDDPLLSGRWIHGLKVWGGLYQLESILTQKRIAGIILAGMENQPDLEALILRCQPFNCWVRRAALEFETVNL